MSRYKGRYKCRNPEKYKGDPTNIVYRSFLEWKYMDWCDTSPSVLRWQSEEFFIGYWSPVDNKPHRYFPDFWVEFITKSGEICQQIVEIKPSQQCKLPNANKKLTKTGRKSRRYFNEMKTYAINQAKWEAANVYAAKRGSTFRVLTERDLGVVYGRDGNGPIARRLAKKKKR